MFTKKEREHLAEVFSASMLTISMVGMFWMLTLGVLLWRVCPFWVTHLMPLGVSMVAGMLAFMPEVLSD